ncbi:nitroreductase family deazaflavin-dependent oxidoreductase [Nocardioides sp. CER19]|uniref:nitroreductase family deazaflavin-dependent oxidoreductase n=1 Tax=Nocardioides sp. CER19 TaxID=3038538 RepID=UPI00244B6E17|nr:nitroreductase family deazaflavin-dependent oxidoreductase [Nocardioides sp. CER19]MDH2413037.1 nitroreductase family deazaflavin-dependent oxidoreductase [Nocardioides sp. CER19]
MTDLLEGEYQPSTQQWVRDNVELYESTGGKEGWYLQGRKDWPVVVITSVGAKSGKLRKNPVMRVEKDGVYLAVASKGGAPEHPIWYHNFVANPTVQLQDGPEPKLYRARLIEDQAEYDEWWARAVDVYEPYADYKPRAEAAGRTIPLFLLEPVD